MELPNSTLALGLRAISSVEHSPTLLLLAVLCLVGGNNLAAGRPGPQPVVFSVPGPLANVFILLTTMSTCA